MPSVDQPIVQGDTIDFVVDLKKDGIIWDISGGTVVLYFRKPDGSILGPLAATISDGPGGVAHYLTDVLLLNVAGDWVRQWKITKTGVVLWSAEIEFEVCEALA